MKYAICLLQNVFLLASLLRMTYLGMHAERARMFVFLSAWLLSSVLALFMAQVFEITSKQYAAAFFICCAFAWACGIPEVMRASAALSKNIPHTITVFLVLAMAIAASRFAVMNAAMHPLAKYLAVNYWVAIFFGTTFILAAAGAERPDWVLWRCVGSFFLIFGFVHLAIGALRIGAWSYSFASLLGCLAWFALAFFLDPNHDAIVNFERLGITVAGWKFLALAKPMERRRG